MIAIDHNDRNAYKELVSSSVQGMLDLMAIEASMKLGWNSTPLDADGMHKLWNNIVKRHIDGISDVPIAMFDAYSRIVQASDYANGATVLNVGSGILKSIQHDYRNCATRMGSTMLAPSRTLTSDQHVMISLGRVSEGENYHHTMNDILASYDNEHITKAVFDTFTIISDILSSASFNNIHMDTRYMIFNLFHAILTNPDDDIHNRSVYALITPTPEHSSIYQYFDHLIEQGHSMESIIKTLSSMHMMNAIIDDNEDTFRNLFTSMIDHHTIPYTSWMMGAFMALDNIRMEHTYDKISISINNGIRSKIMNIADIEPDTAMGFIRILELMESLETQSQRLADIVFHHRHDTLTYQALVRTAQGLSEGLPMSYLEETFMMDTNGFSKESWYHEYMETIYNRYSTEDGSLHIGTSKGYSCFPNTSGDGEFDITIAASWDIDTDGYEYLGMVGGEGFNVYGDGHDEAIALLRGRWGVYADFINNGNMMLRPFDHDSTVMIPHQ